MRTPDRPYVNRIIGASIRDSIKNYWMEACPKCGSKEEKRMKAMFSGKMHYIYYCSKCATDKRIEKYTMDELFDKQIRDL